LPAQDTHTYTIAIDAMGSDAHPEVEVRAALEATKNQKASRHRLKIKLVGDEVVLSTLLNQHRPSNRDDLSRDIEIIHASDVIEMTDNPATAARRKTDASMNVAISLVKDGRADAMISAGNSGAIMACALFKLKRIKGIERPALLTTMPSSKGRISLLDVGANNDCKTSHLVQFGMIGAAYAAEILGHNRPKVCLVANGSEDNKGTEETREAHQILSNTQLNFHGYIEGRDIFDGDIQVVVCDGYSGNLILKVAEGAATFVGKMIKTEVLRNPITKASGFGLKKGLNRIKQIVSYEEIGGAPLLGVNGNVFVCHGSSSSKAIVNAIENACKMIESNFVQKLPKYIEV